MERELIIPAGVDRNSMVFAPGVRVGDLIYLSGSVGSRDGEIVGDDVETQAMQAMQNLGRVLEAAGSGWEKVVRVNCYLTEPDRDYAGWNKVRKLYFPKDPPTSRTVAATIVAPGALIEVELIASV